MRRLALAALLGLPALLQAQVVRGRLTERSSAAPLGGVVVEVFPAGEPRRVGASLSSPDGTFAIRLPAAGRYVLTAKRIGVRRVQTASFDVADGETVVRDLQIEAVLYVLPEVVVTGIATCTRGGASAARLASLWEEARTALFASQLSLRDELFRAHVTRYVRELEPTDARILSETRSEMSGVVSRPFTSVNPDSLSLRGYWWEEPDGSTVYYGPDAEVLLSDAFVRDHCFEERRQRNRRGLVGLGFRPMPERELPDVLGTLWLDERTFELRFVEFTYTRRIPNVSQSLLGGEVHFARLGSGAWIVRRWYIRLPLTARPTSPLSTRTTLAPWMLVRPVTFKLREEGGEVAAEELVQRAAMATVTGIVRDSANQPWEGALIRLAGSRLTTTARASGAFSVDSVPYGTWSLLVEAPGYDTLGLAAAEGRVEVAEGRPARVNLRARNTRDLFTRLCPGRTARRGTGALRVSVRTLGGDSLVSNLPVQVTWAATDRRGNTEPGYIERRTDGDGRVTLCEVPSGLELTVIVARFNGGAMDATKVTVPDRGVVGLALRSAP